MSRNTHNRLIDHHGNDLTTNIVLADPTYSYGDGDYLQDVLNDIDDRIVLGTGGGGGLADLVTGDDQTFDASLGAWVEVGAGTLTRDTSYKMTGATASLKFASSTAGDYTELAIAGTFSANTDYWAVFFISCEDTSGTKSMDLHFGLLGTDDTVDSIALNMATGYPYVGDGNFVAYGVHWRPSADRTGVKVRLDINFSTSVTWHIGMMRVWQTPVLGPIRVHTDGQPYFPTVTSSGGMVFNPWGSGDGLSVTPAGTVYMGTYGGAAGYDASPSYGHFMWAEHTPGDLADAGTEMEFGDDYVGIYISEKDSDTVQLYADSSGGYHIELRDRGGKGWEANDGTYITPLANLHYVKVGTADPSAGGGVVAPIGATYHRDNSGAGELWLKTAAGATAWTKLNVP